MNLIEKRRKRCKLIFGEEMIPCPKCKSYNLHYRKPVKLNNENFSVRQLITKTLLEEKLEGPVYIMCSECGHVGPSLDCSNKTLSEVRKDPEIAKKVRNLWNNQ